MPDRIYLSPPHIGEFERAFVQEAFDTNWIAPVGPHVDAFEQEIAEAVGASHAVALSSGTAALHLALRYLGLEAGDEVLVSTFTFSASVNPILYEGGRPVFIDSETRSWNLDPNLVEDVLQVRAETGKSPKALIAVDLYGQTADMDPLITLCERYGVTLIEDAAEALGADYKGRSAGTFGKAGVFSFNGNKVITTSGGGMLVTEDGDFARHVKKLSTQARDDAPHYQHSEVGFNYRLSNVLAGIGRGQLQKLEDRVAARRANFEAYEDALGDLPGVAFMPDAGWGRHTRWLTVLTIDPEAFGATREDVRLALEAENIEARPVWKPMHLQPVFAEYDYVGGDPRLESGTGVAERIFKQGLCLPSGSSLTGEDRARVVGVVRECRGNAV